VGKIHPWSAKHATWEGTHSHFAIGEPRRQPVGLHEWEHCAVLFQVGPSCTPTPASEGRLLVHVDHIKHERSYITHEHLAHNRNCPPCPPTQNSLRCRHF
jgi:hypothetical protein